MLDEATRTAILKLHEQDHGSRSIARPLRVSRDAVRRVIASDSATVPPLMRAELAEPWREQILELYARYKGHLGRVHGALKERGATVSYAALTAFCRRHGIGSAPPPPAGRYFYNPCSEMQHDTSPHEAKIDGIMTRIQSASLVLCHSRMIFFQHYPRFTRFECKAFLAQAIAYFGGAAERPYLKTLPLYVPDVYQLCTRIVDAEGHVHLNRVRYSAPYRLIGRALEVRETLERVDLYDGPRRVATHARVYGPLDTRVTDPAHRPPRGQGLSRHPQPAPEQLEILQIEPRLASYLHALKLAIGDRRAPLRRLLSMLQEYPREAFLTAIGIAERYRLFDLDRLEKIVIRQVADDFFPPALGSDDE